MTTRTGTGYQVFNNDTYTCCVCVRILIDIYLVRCCDAAAAAAVCFFVPSPFIIAHRPLLLPPSLPVKVQILPHYGSWIFIATRLQPSIPSSTVLELHPPSYPRYMYKGRSQKIVHFFLHIKSTPVAWYCCRGSACLGCTTNKINYVGSSLTECIRTNSY